MDEAEGQAAKAAARRIIRACGYDPNEVSNFQMYPNSIRLVLWPEGGPGSREPMRRVSIRIPNASQFWTGK